ARKDAPERERGAALLGDERGARELVAARGGVAPRQEQRLETAGRRRVFRERIRLLRPADGATGAKLDAVSTARAGYERDRAEDALVVHRAPRLRREHADDAVALHGVDEQPVAVDGAAAEPLA